MIKEIFVRSPYNYDMDVVSEETGLDCSVEKSLTHQSFRDECDINTIVNRFGLTGSLPENVRMPEYGDFTSVTDFHTAMNAVVMAQEAFEEMPANVRARFHNDPGEFVDFCMNDDNRAEAEKLGLVAAEKLAEALKPPVVVAGAVVAPAVETPKAS